MDHLHEPQHDEINLIRLVRRLEKSASNQEEWEEQLKQHQDRAWLNAQSALQKVKYARKLVKNIEIYGEITPKKTQQLDRTKSKIDQVELFLNDIQQRSASVPTRPPPILPTIPIPQAPIKPEDDPMISEEPASELLPESSPTDPSLVPPLDPSHHPIPSLLPATPIPTISTSGTTALASRPTNATQRNVGQSSDILHEQLTAQLAQMSAQLKRNAVYFSESLGRDKSVVEEAKEKIESNFDVMQKERIRLRDHRGKSWGTTGMMLGVVLAVVLIFMLMVSLIRFSSRG